MPQLNYQAALQLPQVSSYRQWAVLTNLPQYLNPSQEVCSQVPLGFSHWSADVITLAVNLEPMESGNIDICLGSWLTIKLNMQYTNNPMQMQTCMHMCGIDTPPKIVLSLIT